MPFTIYDPIGYDLKRKFASGNNTVASIYSSTRLLHGWWRLGSAYYDSGDSRFLDSSGNNKFGTFDAGQDPDNAAGVTPQVRINANSSAWTNNNDAVKVGTVTTWNEIIGSGVKSTKKITISAWVRPSAFGGAAATYRGKKIISIGVDTDDEYNGSFDIHWYNASHVGGGDVKNYELALSTRWTAGQQATGDVPGQTVYTTWSTDYVESSAAVGFAGLQANNWYHIVVTYDASNPSLNPCFYVNGKKYPTKLRSSTRPGPGAEWLGFINANRSPVSGFYIGNVEKRTSLATAGDVAFVGNICDVAVWGSILSYEEANALYAVKNNLAYRGYRDYSKKGSHIAGLQGSTIKTYQGVNISSILSASAGTGSIAPYYGGGMGVRTIPRVATCGIGEFTRLHVGGTNPFSKHFDDTVYIPRPESTLESFKHDLLDPIQAGNNAAQSSFNFVPAFGLRTNNYHYPNFIKHLSYWDSVAIFPWLTGSTYEGNSNSLKPNTSYSIIPQLVTHFTPTQSGKSFRKSLIRVPRGILEFGHDQVPDVMGVLGFSNFFMAVPVAAGGQGLQFDIEFRLVVTPTNNQNDVPTGNPQVDPLPMLIQIKVDGSANRDAASVAELIRIAFTCVDPAGAILPNGETAVSADIVYAPAGEIGSLGTSLGITAERYAEYLSPYAIESNKNADKTVFWNGASPVTQNISSMVAIRNHVVSALMDENPILFVYPGDKTSGIRLSRKGVGASNGTFASFFKNQVTDLTVLGKKPAKMETPIVFDVPKQSFTGYGSLTQYDDVNVFVDAEKYSGHAFLENPTARIFPVNIAHAGMLEERLYDGVLEAYPIRDEIMFKTDMIHRRGGAKGDLGSSYSTCHPGWGATEIVSQERRDSPRAPYFLDAPRGVHMHRPAQYAILTGSSKVPKSMEGDPNLRGRLAYARFLRDTVRPSHRSSIQTGLSLSPSLIDYSVPGNQADQLSNDDFISFYVAPSYGTWVTNNTPSSLDGTGTFNITFKLVNPDGPLTQAQFNALAPGARDAFIMICTDINTTPEGWEDAVYRIVQAINGQKAWHENGGEVHLAIMTGSMWTNGLPGIRAQSIYIDSETKAFPNNQGDALRSGGTQLKISPDINIYSQYQTVHANKCYIQAYGSNLQVPDARSRQYKWPFSMTSYDIKQYLFGGSNPGERHTFFVTSSFSAAKAATPSLPDYQNIDFGKISPFIEYQTYMQVNETLLMQNTAGGNTLDPLIGALFDMYNPPNPAAFRIQRIQARGPQNLQGPQNVIEAFSPQVSGLSSTELLRSFLTRLPTGDQELAGSGLGNLVRPTPVPYQPNPSVDRQRMNLVAVSSDIPWRAAPVEAIRAAVAMSRRANNPNPGLNFSGIARANRDIAAVGLAVAGDDPVGQLQAPADQGAGGLPMIKGRTGFYFHNIRDSIAFGDL